MKNFSLISNPDLLLYLFKEDNNIVYIDSLPYVGVQLNKKFNLKESVKIKSKSFKKQNKRWFK